MDRSPHPKDITQRAFVFACRILRLCDVLIRRGGVAALIGRQLAKAGSSLGANLEEAKGAQSRPDFITKNCIALKEGREALYWLRIVEATIQPLPADSCELRQESHELVAILTTIVKNLRLRTVKR